METRSKGRGAPSEPKGGYEAIGVGQLAMAWWAYQRGLIRKLDLRVWFACWELEIRRRLSGQKSKKKYEPSLKDLRKLVGEGELRASIKRLLKIGLLQKCSKAGITFIESPDQLNVEDLSTLYVMLKELGSFRRKIPVPRRILRRLAGGLSKARTACVIAHLIRCLFYYKGEGCRPSGCCKASWIARLFGITERSVHDARRYLIEELGWLIPQECNQETLNRDGLWVTIDLEWGPEEAAPIADLPLEESAGEGGVPEVNPTTVPMAVPEPVLMAVPEPVLTEPPTVVDDIPQPTNFHPLSADSPGHFSPPSLLGNKNPPAECKNQKPAGGGTPGVQISTVNDGEKTPTLLDITVTDLKSVPRLLILHEEAVAKGLITSSEADRLKFLAGAMHALSVGSNPTRLFAWMIWKVRWEFITQADEDEASSRLKKSRRIDMPEPATKQGKGGAGLSQDARLAREIREILRRRGIHVDPFASAQPHLPGWTRERWDAAVAEADGRRSTTGLGGIFGKLGFSPMSPSNV